MAKKAKEQAESVVVDDDFKVVVDGDFHQEMHGVGIEKHEGKWLAVRVSSHGTVEVLNPLRHGQVEGESKALALARAYQAFVFDSTGKRI